MTPSKFKKYVERCALEFEQKLSAVSEINSANAGDKILPFYALAEEWLEDLLKNKSKNYYARGKEITKKFNDYLQEIKFRFNYNFSNNYCFCNCY